MGNGEKNSAIFKIQLSKHNGIIVHCFILVINDKNVQQNYALFFKILSPRYIVEAAGLNLRGCF